MESTYINVCLGTMTQEVRGKEKERYSKSTKLPPRYCTSAIASKELSPTMLKDQQPFHHVKESRRANVTTYLDKCCNNQSRAPSSPESAVYFQGCVQNRSGVSNDFMRDRLERSRIKTPRHFKEQEGISPPITNLTSRLIYT